MLRAQGLGWVQLCCVDGRRGVWMRVSDLAIELCAGREGDDADLRLLVGSRVTPDDLRNAREILNCVEFARDCCRDPDGTQKTD